MEVEVTVMRCSYSMKAGGQGILPFRGAARPWFNVLSVAIILSA